MSPVQPPKEPFETTADQINDLFDSIELTKAVETEEFKQFLDYILLRSWSRNSFKETNAFAMQIRRSKLSPASPARIAVGGGGRFRPRLGMKPI